MTILKMLLRLRIGLGLGAVNGIESQWRARMAGLRTTGGTGSPPQWRVPQVHSPR